MNPILKLTFRLLQAIAIVSLNIHYRKIVYVNRHFQTAKGPLLIVSNHMNTGLDPLFALMYSREPCFILANYTLFKNPISKAVLSTLFCIPIQRIQDIAPGETPKNEDAFRACDEHLRSGGSIYVAPEGASYAERRIRECKTGTARIVFSAESKNDFELDLRILPVGITYYDGLKFGTDVVVEIGEPFSADAYQKAYTENPRQAIHDLTNDIENQFKKLTLHCQNKEEDDFLKKLEILLNNEKPLDTEGVHWRSKKLLATLQKWQATDSADFNVFKNNVEQYFSFLNTKKIKDFSTQTSNIPLSILGILIALPAFLIGFLGNIIPAWLSNSMIRLAKVDMSYDSTIRYCAGVVFFPLFWWLECEVLFWGKDLNFFETLTYLIVIVGTGLLAWRVYTEGQKVLNFYRFKNTNRQGILTNMRKPLMAKLLSITE